MTARAHPQIEIPPELVEAIRGFPLEREVEHCGSRFTVSPFDIYGTCPRCRAQLKLRAFAGNTELEDVFDAVFEWLRQPEASRLMEQRHSDMAADEE
jgi:hypothetical protein